jgi:hypothetical protein
MRSTTPHASLPQAGLRLPPGFHRRDAQGAARGSAHAEACRLAAAGEAEAATLVLGGHPDLVEFAVVLAPEEPLRTARRAFVAGMAALADTIGIFGPPEIPVRIGWPGTLLFNGARLGGGRLSWPEACAEDAEPEWLVFSASLIVSKAEAGDPGLTPESTALEDEGFPPELRDAFAETFARHLTKAFEVWREDGFDHVAARYRARLDGGPGPGDIFEGAGLAAALLVPAWHDPETGGVRL